MQFRNFLLRLLSGGKGGEGGEEEGDKLRRNLVRALSPSLPQTPERERKWFSPTPPPPTSLSPEMSPGRHAAAEEEKKGRNFLPPPSHLSSFAALKGFPPFLFASIFPSSALSRGRIRRVGGSGRRRDPPTRKKLGQKKSFPSCASACYRKS